MEFPALVYKPKGPFQRIGGTYDCKGVDNIEQLKDAISNGWFASMPEAIAGKHQIDDTAISDDAPPTRSELEEKGRELGLKFDGRTSDKKLFAMIEEALR